MEPNFQTSFIPKKPMVEERVSSSRPVGLLTIVSIFVFFAVVLGIGGLYFYKTILERKITQMESTLNLAKDRFPPAEIVRFQELDRRLIASKQVLAEHMTVSPIFEILQDITLKTVQYTDFSYQAGQAGEDGEAGVLVTMQGITNGYRSVALQSDLFTENESLIDPVFSNLSLDSNGNVLFDLEFSVDPSLINYKQNY